MVPNLGNQAVSNWEILQLAPPQPAINVARPNTGHITSTVISVSTCAYCDAVYGTMRARARLITRHNGIHRSTPLTAMAGYSGIPLESSKALSCWILWQIPPKAQTCNYGGENNDNESKKAMD